MRCIRWDVWIRRLSAAAAVGVLVSSAAWPFTATADDEAPKTKAESPYFFVKSDDPSIDRLPLKSTKVDVKIAGVIADVTVTQRYRNEGSRPIEARYVFPGGTRSAIDGMTVRVADRVLTANIREKQAARVEYETAKSAGKTAALLEQHRANVFEMNVANIVPGDDVAVELHYTELIVPVDGQYEFVFPTVVGPRYNGSTASASGTGEKWVATPYLHEGERSSATFDLHVRARVADRHPRGDIEYARPRRQARRRTERRRRQRARRHRPREAGSEQTIATSSSTIASPERPSRPACCSTAAGTRTSSLR